MDAIYATFVEALQAKPSTGVVWETFPDFRIYLTDPFGDAPAFNVLYSYDTEHIYLHAITTAKL